MRRNCTGPLSPSFTASDHTTSATYDLRFGLDRTQTFARAGATLHERLLQSGFSARQWGSHGLPVTQYVPGSGKAASPSSIYMEFLTPRKGAKKDRRGVNQGIVEVQPGLHAQTDPYLGLLLAERITVKASTIRELKLSGDHCISLPHPACFILQKLLIHQQRESRQR